MKKIETHEARHIWEGINRLSLYIFHVNNEFQEARLRDKSTTYFIRNYNALEFLYESLKEYFERENNDSERNS